MKSFEEICDKYQKLPVRVELDLRYALRNGKPKKRWERKYYLSLRDLLEKEGYIEFVFPQYRISENGKKVLKRGWVAKRVVLLILPIFKKLLFGFFG